MGRIYSRSRPGSSFFPALVRRVATGRRWAAIQDLDADEFPVIVRRACANIELQDWSDNVARLRLVMEPLVKVFLRACAETPRGYFAPAIALWRLFVETAEGRST